MQTTVELICLQMRKSIVHQVVTKSNGGRRLGHKIVNHPGNVIDVTFAFFVRSFTATFKSRDDFSFRFPIYFGATNATMSMACIWLWVIDHKTVSSIRLLLLLNVPFKCVFTVWNVWNYYANETTYRIRMKFAMCTMMNIERKMKIRFRIELISNSVCVCAVCVLFCCWFLKNFNARAFCCITC